MGTAALILNLGVGLVATVVAIPVSLRIGLHPLEPLLWLWAPAVAFFAASAGLRSGSRTWVRWMAVVLNLGCVAVLAALAGVAATGLVGSLALFPPLALGAALAAFNTVLLIRRCVASR